jgi:hypothetical protein
MGKLFDDTRNMMIWDALDDMIMFGNKNKIINGI